MSNHDPLIYEMMARDVIGTLQALGCKDIHARLKQAVRLETVGAQADQVADFVDVLATGAISDGFMYRMRHSGIRDMTTRPGADHDPDS